MIYTVTCNPALDYVVGLDAMQLGTINRAASESLQLGGKGINVSQVLHNLGIQSVALGFIAGFTGQALAAGLQQLGILTDLIPLETGMTRINVKIKGRQETELNGQGPAIPQWAVTALLEKLDRLQTGDILVISGSVPATMPGDSYEQLLQRLDGRGVLAVVDAAGELLLRTLAYRPFLIKPNHVELGALFGRTLASEGEIIHCARQLQDRGARNVLVSRAGDGALLLDEQGQVHRQLAPQGRVRNSVGAGDSMVAGFLAGWLRTGAYNEALRWGTAAGSATAFSVGLADRTAIHTLLEQI